MFLPGEPSNSISHQLYTPGYHCIIMTQAASLPSAPVIHLGANIVLQPPLSRCGRGPGLIILRPSGFADYQQRNDSLDPEPLQKWAEESYVVVQISLDSQSSGDKARVARLVTAGIDALVSLAECETKDRFGLLGRAVFYRFYYVFTNSTQFTGPRRIMRRSLLMHFGLS